MITVKETLGVSADSFFQQILTSAIYDIKQAADKNLTEQQLHKGYQYTKKMRSKLVQRCRNNSEYSARYFCQHKAEEGGDAGCIVD